MTPSSLDGQPTRLLKRRRDEDDSSAARRSTHACHRCKRMKQKCYFSSSQKECAACAKAKEECIYDFTPDGIPRGTEYVTTLESRIRALENELQIFDPTSSLTQSTSTSAHNQSSAPVDSPTNANASRRRRPETSRVTLETTSDITAFNVLHTISSINTASTHDLHVLPSRKLADILIERAFQHTQARYCIIDWAQLYEWHGRREDICASSAQDDQIGAYFIWIIYALGARYASNDMVDTHAPEAYYQSASTYLPAVLEAQDLTAVQALLCLTQHLFRATGGPSQWHLIGMTMRICIDLGFHRKPSASMIASNSDPFKLELQKRAFWCTYCFDRLVSFLLRRPFGIQDADIDVDPPVDIDVTCKDQEKIRDLQMRQSQGETVMNAGQKTTMSAALHHLQIYRLKSKIMTHFASPRSLPPNYEDVMSLLMEIEEWRATAPSKRTPKILPEQNEETVQYMYHQTVLSLIRPMLLLGDVHPSLINNFAELSGKACENSRTVSLSSVTPQSSSNMYTCFLNGITLLLCLMVQPSSLSLPRAVRATTLCSSALTVYCRTLSRVAPFLELFEHVSGLVLESISDPNSSTPNLRNVLDRILSSDAAEIPGLSKTIIEYEDQTFPITPDTNMSLPLNTQDMFLDLESFTAWDLADWTFPFELGMIPPT